MDGQLTLNMVRTTDPDTSRAAAVLALPRPGDARPPAGPSSPEPAA